jgi:hypothetical protein
VLAAALARLVLRVCRRCAAANLCVCAMLRGTGRRHSAGSICRDCDALG